MKGISTILPYLRGKWQYIVAFICTNFLSVLFNTVSIGLLIPFLNMLFGKEMMVHDNPGLHFSKSGISTYFKYQFTQFIEQHGGNKEWGLILICVLVTSAIFLKNLFLYLSKYILIPLRNGIVYNIRQSLFTKTISLPIGFFTNERKGDIISRMSNDVNNIENSIVSTMELFFSKPIEIIFYLIVLCITSFKLFFFLLVFLPIAGLIIGTITKNLKKFSMSSQEKSGNLISIIEETLGGLRIIKAFKAEQQRISIFEKENAQLQQLANRMATKRELASPMSEFLGVCILCVIIWFGGKMVLSQSSTLEAGTFIMFIGLFYFLINPLKSLSQISNNIQQGSASIERIHKILSATDTITEAPHATAINTLNTDIEFKNVSFGYEGNLLLKNINLKITKGKTLAIVGASGAGKSTLVDLLPRFHDVIDGRILIDGLDIRTLTVASLRNLFGIVSQDPILFNDTIKHNLMLGIDDVPLTAIEKAARIANAHEFIIQKPEGYNTLIGDRGTKLSGGEKQRLTIARAVLKNPAILILDEATSSLDTVSERQVQTAINNLMKNRTCIVIAHRLSTVQNADEIIVLKKGEIVERGTHTELLTLNGIYSELVSMQQLH